MLEANTVGFPLASAEMKAAVAAVAKGVLAALGSSGAGVVETTMQAIARFAFSREGSDPRVVATLICDAASVIELPEDDQRFYLDSMIGGALAACDHLPEPQREELAACLRSALPASLRQSAGPSDQPARREPNAAWHHLSPERTHRWRSPPESQRT